MAVFRRRDKDFVPSSSPSLVIKEIVNSEFAVGKTSVSTEKVVERTLKEFHFVHEIPRESYSINEQISAGVSLKEIPCGTRLDSPDNLDYEQSEGAEEQILTQLNNVENNE